MPHNLSHWTIERARRSCVALVAAVIVATTACGSDSPAGPDTSSTPVGSYVLSKVNGKALPAPLYADGSYSFDVLSGKLTLTSDGKYMAVTTTRQTLPGSVETFVDTLGGTWTLSGATVQMTSTSDTTTTTATWANRTLTLTAADADFTATILYTLSK